MKFKTKPALSSIKILFSKLKRYTSSLISAMPAGLKDFGSILIYSYTSCCWISLSIYGHGQWLVSTKIDLTPRSDNGKINSSPVTRSPAIVRFQESCNKTIRIPVEDPEGDFVKCRWASVAESAIPSDSFPYGALDEVIIFH